ncbi:MAG: hypothetical protein AB7P03_17830 [Kofleriaceae bacterium]
MPACDPAKRLVALDDAWHVRIMMRSRWLTLVLTVGAPTMLVSCTEQAAAPATGQSRVCLDNAPNEYRFVAAGTGFGEYDGRTIHALTLIELSHVDGECVSTVSGTIDGGAFELEAINRVADQAYPDAGVFIDLDGDGQCEPGQDLIWGVVAILGPDGIRFQLTPNDLSADDEIGTCARFAAAARTTLRPD